MKTRHPSSLRTLLLLCLLAVGPVQAQLAYACAMMDMIVHDDCCCDDAAGDADRRAERGTPIDGEHSPCCEVSVEITVDQETRQHTPVFKPPDSDLEPTPAAIAAFPGLSLPSRPPATDTHPFNRLLPDVGSDTWLITRRLRI